MLIVKEHHFDGLNIAEAAVDLMKPYFAQASLIGTKGYPLEDVYVKDGQILLVFNDMDDREGFLKAISDSNIALL